MLSVRELRPLSLHSYKSFCNSSEIWLKGREETNERHQKHDLSSRLCEMLKLLKWVITEFSVPQLKSPYDLQTKPDLTLRFPDYRTYLTQKVRILTYWLIKTSV